MPLTDLPQSVLFTIFLLLFVLVGIYPAWKKTAKRLRKVLREAGNKDTDEILPAADFHVKSPFSEQLSDFEIFILRRLAQASNKPLSTKQLNADLHFEKPMLKAALNSLLQRGLINMSLSYRPGIRFVLSPNGRNYASEQGFIPRVHSQS